MIGHLTAADFTVMPWANGRGQTVEMFRMDRDGVLLWRISRAAVVEDGPFSLFPGVDRNLTVISGPGFDLRGEASLRADPLQPLAFSGDLALRAEGVRAPCDDLNVMVRRGAARAEVLVQEGGTTQGGVALFALGPVRARRIVMAAQELILADEPVRFEGRAIVVRLIGDGPGLPA
jgi:environmental stress-induced protein Ves